MSPADRAKILFYQELDGAGTVQKAAEALCAALIKAKLCENPCCHWHVNDLSDEFYGHSDSPGKPADCGADSDLSSSPIKQHVQLVKEQHFGFALELPDTELEAIEKDGLVKAMLDYAKLRIRFLLSESTLHGVHGISSTYPVKVGRRNTVRGDMERRESR